MITNLYIGLHRELRGERLAAMRLIQVHAVDSLMTYLDLTGQSSRERQDPFAVERGAERRLEAPFTELVPGYDKNREAALAMLAWLEERVEVDPTLAYDREGTFDEAMRLHANMNHMHLIDPSTNLVL